MRFYFEEEPIAKQEAREILGDEEFERLLEIIESCDGECIDIHSGRLDYEGLRDTTVEIDGKGLYSETGEVDETAKVLA